MKASNSIAIFCLIWSNLHLQHAAPASSGERVHIRLHMPEIVRQHTHVHKVYKFLPPPATAMGHPGPPKKLLPLAASSSSSSSGGRPHVSLLGYTTTASGTGVLSPNLMQLMASAATPMQAAPTLTPNYGPALFDSYNQESTTVKPTPSTGSKQQQMLLQQIFRPNVMAAITAAQQQKQHIDMDSELDLEPEPDLEHNELLNNNLMAALQREYMSKFGMGPRKRKKAKYASNYNNYRRPQPEKQLQKYNNYVQELQSTEESFDDYNDTPITGGGYEDESPQREEQQHYMERPNSFLEDDGAPYDSAVAFSGQHNGLAPMPTVDDFLNDVSDNSYAPFYDDYGTSSGSGTRTSSGPSSWHSSPVFSTKPTPTLWRPRQRRPSSEFGSGSGSGTGNGNGNSGKMRYIKLTTRKKRKNRIKSKRYRI